MQKIRALFWDVGGVLLTNAWDHEERDQAVERYLLSKTEFEELHNELAPKFEEGKLTFDEYLDRVIFYQPRTFSREEFKQFMFSLSKPKPQSLELARALSVKYFMGTINNESRELNEYRIRSFGLAEYFDVFVSSCYVALRKPDERIYKLALDLTQHTPEECCFIDDRPPNIEGATKAGFATVLMKDPQQLRRDLQSLGVEA
ncbi:MAG TPA: HAD family phosphatase [Terriglobales bacterium]|nr:HAD family phosphatase [Terriglobales bacterium]